MNNDIEYILIKAFKSNNYDCIGPLLKETLEHDSDYRIFNAIEDDLIDMLTVLTDDDWETNENIGDPTAMSSLAYILSQVTGKSEEYDFSTGTQLCDYYNIDKQKFEKLIRHTINELYQLKGELE